MLAVHGGVGFSIPDEAAKWCSDALSAAEEDITAAVKALEDHKYFNCGVGSNLSAQGTVECEASYMTSRYHKFGAVGCVTTIKNPVCAAKGLAMDEGVHGLLVRPQVLVGKGAETWALEKGFQMCEPEYHITPQALHEWQKTSQMVAEQNDCVFDKLDTVGGVALKDGHAEACVSSGGIILKRPGRLGHSTNFGAGVWADKKNDRLIAVSASGCGEAMVRTDFCRSLAQAVLRRSSHDLPAQVVEQWFQTEFLRSPYLSDLPNKLILAGGIVMLQEQGCSELLVFHNTPAFPVAYKTRGKTKRVISKLTRGVVKCDSYLL